MGYEHLWGINICYTFCSSGKISPVDKKFRVLGLKSNLLKSNFIDEEKTTYILTVRSHTHSGGEFRKKLEFNI